MENSYRIERTPRYQNIAMCLYFMTFIIYLIGSTCILTLAPLNYSLFWVFCIIQTIFNIIIGIGLPLSYIYKNIKVTIKYIQYIIHFLQSIIFFILPNNSDKMIDYYNTPVFTLFICNIIINILFAVYYYINLSVPKIRYIAVPHV